MRYERMHIMVHTFQIHVYNVHPFTSAIFNDPRGLKEVAGREARV